VARYRVTNPVVVWPVLNIATTHGTGLADRRVKWGYFIAGNEPSECKCDTVGVTERDRM
jgi:hypothetical protein